MMFPIHRRFEPGELVTPTSASCYGFSLDGTCWHLSIDGSVCVVLSAESFDLDNDPNAALHDKTPVLWHDGDVVCVWDHHVSRVEWETT